VIVGGTDESRIGPGVGCVVGVTVIVSNDSEVVVVAAPAVLAGNVTPWL